MNTAEVAPLEPSGPRRRRVWIAAAVALLVAVAGGVGYAASNARHQPATAPAAMAQRAQQVMPFDLNRTVHTFTKTADGGVQQVVVKDPSDTRDLALIRSHLRAEAERFHRGDYADPARIHGMDMPGVSELAAGAARVKVVVVELPRGAQVTYSSSDPTLVSAIHAWFDRQTSDHAMPGMGG